jgi:hypothetical protein
MAQTIAIRARWAALVLGVASSGVLAYGQNQVVSVGFGGYANLPTVALGGILTLVTTALGVPDAVATQIPLPTSLSGVSVLARVMGAKDTTGYPASLPILRVYTSNALQMPDGVYCPTVPNSVYCSNSQITVEIPTEAVCAPGSGSGPPETCTVSFYHDLPPLLVLNVSVNGVTGPDLPLQVQLSAPHLLNSCDSIFGPQLSSTCHPLVTHADGTLVSSSSPARVGETITLYAVGLGFLEIGRASCRERV